MNTQSIADICGHNEKAIEAMRKKWKRKGLLNFDRNYTPTDAEMSALGSPASGRKSKPKTTRTQVAAKVSGSDKSDAGQFEVMAVDPISALPGITIDEKWLTDKIKELSAPIPAPKEETPSALSGHFLRTDKFLFVTLFAAMVGQMIHTAGFFYLNSPLEDSRLRFGLAALFAIGVDCTALVMTIHRGGLLYLVSFALFHFAVNITFHTQVHEDPTWGAIFGYVLLSGVLAFSNFSYTDLFSKK